ncbi:MAG: 4Fe-4S binding protein [Desulfovibrionales bacterium]
MIRFQRGVQAFFLLLFLLLIVLTTFPLGGVIPADRIMLLDPVLALGAMLSAREVLALSLLIPLLVLLAATVLLGRIFCSHICPLGTIQDLAGTLIRPRKGAVPHTLRHGKYLVLGGLVAAALLGVNLTHFAAPLSLAGRLVVLMVLPFGQFLLEPAAGVLRSGADMLGTGLPERFFQDLRYTTLGFHLLFFSTFFAALTFASRFWCRFVCPSGAFLALLGRRPLFPRRVSEGCSGCGRCQRSCPVGAVSPQDPKTVAGGECITCRTCADVCPEGAVTFGMREKGLETSPLALPSRRGVIASIGAGLALAFVARRGTGEYWPKGESGNIMPQGLIRPPGAVPEIEFLNLCTRCGLCIKVCPTNMLQPAGYGTGFSPYLSPLAVSRRGPCEPDCNQCGQVCPTRAIAPLSVTEKPWAKMGTARVIPNKCLAWEFDRACLICDEACPYDAISLVPAPGLTVAVPVVDEFKCAGCGWCEFRCPVVAKAAIVVTPMAALRLRSDADYPRRAKEAGLSITRASEAGAEHGEPEGGWEDEGGLPPGFSE